MSQYASYSGYIGGSSGGGGGSVNDVTASAPISSTGGATPNIAISTASTSTNGALTSTDWNTFNNKQAALSLGNLTDAGTDGIVITGGTGSVVGAGTSIAQHVADSTHNGYLLAADWISFNAKQAAGNYVTALTGDVTATGPGSVAATLATVNSNVGSFGSSTSIPTFTVNAKGLITAASGNAVIAPAGTLSGTTLNATVVTSSLTAVGTLATGVWNATTIGVSKGGTGLTTLTANNVILGNGTSNPLFVAPGTSGNVLTSNGTTWTSSAVAASANAALSNLASVAINTDLIFGTTVVGSIKTKDGTDSENILIRSGDGSSTSGDIILHPGTSAGSPGQIKLVDGSEGNTGDIWTSTNADGAGTWVTYPTPAGFMGSIKWAITSGAYWQVAGPSGFANFGVNGTPPTPTVTNKALDPGSNILGVKFASMVAGTYRFVAYGTFYEIGGNGNAHQIRFSDGTNTTNPVDMYVSSSGGLAFGSIEGVLRYGSTQTNLTIRLQALSDGTDIVRADLDSNFGGTSNSIQIDVYFFPDA